MLEVAESGTRKEIEERALLFQVGDEVLVTIEEPHVQRRHAVARADPSIVSVAGAACSSASESWWIDSGPLGGAGIAINGAGQDRSDGSGESVGTKQIVDPTAPRPQRR